MIRRAPAAAAALALLAGCSSSPSDPVSTEPAPPPAGTGYFVGSGPDGLGASLDLLADDPVVRAVAAALRARDGRPGTVASVGVASVVNDGPRPIPVPRFVAVLEAGGALALRAPGEILATTDGPVARRALARLGAPPSRIRAGGATTSYVVLEGALPAGVASVRMVAGGASVTLTARRR